MHIVHVALVGLALLAAPLAHAGDGRVEINQASVEAAGGFPYAINQPGSYVLTSNLVVSDATRGGITISSEGVTLDLNGFTVRGPITCARSDSSQYDPALLACTGSSTANGIVANTRSVIRNGRVTGFGRYGIQAGGSLWAPVLVEDVQVDQNAQGGISFAGGTVRGALVTLNGGDGIFYVAAGSAGSSTVLEDCNVAFNKGDGVAIAGKIRNCRISYNGGDGIVHGNAGGQDSSITDCFIYRNVGKGINAYGSYRDCEIDGNDATGGQVIGSMSDEGGNNVH